MSNANAVGRFHLKSKLLIGAAGMAAAAISNAAAAGDAAGTAPLPADDPKWLPYADIGGGVGSGFVQGKVDMFAPVWQDMDSLIFVRLGVGTETHNTELLNAGVGFRTKIDPDWILGIFGGADDTRTDQGVSFSQLSLGAELMSTDWDLRVNGYSAKHDSKPISNAFELYIHDTTIAILQAQQAAFSGFDGEVGYRIFNTDSTDVRVFAGGFVFQNNHDAGGMLNGQNLDFPYKRMAGPRGRAEVNMFDLDVLGSQSRLTLDGEVAHDSVRGTTGFAGATLRIPIGLWGDGAQALDDLDRRMVDPVRRNDDVMTQWHFNKPEPVIIYNSHVTSHPTNTLYYVAGSTQGAGTYADPTTLNDAASRDSVNPFVVVTDLGGNVTSSNAQSVVNATFVGGGQTFTVRGVDSGRTFTHTFAPGSGTPTIVPTTAGDNLLDVASGDAVEDINFAGPFGAAIYGHNVGQVDITEVNIDGTGGGQYGVLFNQDASGDLDLHISDSTINGVSDDGVYVYSNIDDGGTSNDTIALTNSTVSNSGNTDVLMTAFATGGSTINQNIVIDPTIIDGGQYGIVIGGSANGGTVTQDISISDTTVRNFTGAGIVIYGYGENSGTLNQNIQLTNVGVYGLGHGGEGTAAVHAAGIGGEIGHYTSGDLIDILAAGYSSAHVTQGFTMSNIVASQAYNDAIFAGSYAGGNAITHQSGSMDHVTTTDTAVSGHNSYGIVVGAYAYHGIATQAVSISHASVSGITGAGIVVYGYANDRGQVVQSASLDHVTVSGLFYETPDLAVVHPALSSGVASYAFGDLIAIEAGANHNSTTTQTFSLSNVTANGAYLDDIGVSAYAGVGSATSQTGAMDHIAASYSIYGDGIDLYSYAHIHNSSVIQQVGISHLTANANYYDGVDVHAKSVGYGIGGALVAQYVQIDHANLTHEYDGIDAHVTSLLDASALQTVTATYAYLSHNYYGVQAGAYAVDGASTQQIITLAHDKANFEHIDGVSAYAETTLQGFAVQTVNIYNSSLSHNVDDGMDVAGTAFAGGDVEQNIGVYYTDMSNNGIDGLDIHALAYGYVAGVAGHYYYSHASQNVIAAYDTISHNAQDGVQITNSAKYGGQINQFVYLFGDTINANAADGVHEQTSVISPGAYGFGLGTAAYADLYIVGTEAHPSTVEHNGGFGVYVSSLADAPFNPAYVLGKTYLIQHVVVGGTDASYNHTAGFGDGALDQGIYSLNIQYVTLADSQFDHNGQFGAGFLAKQYFGPYSFGAAIQDITISGSDFSHNGLYGMAGLAYASGFQGRAEQNFNISDSQFDNNGKDGIYLYRDAHDGVYVPGYGCGTVQGVTGGCAFVRQTVQISGSDISNNGGDGIYLKTVAENYGAVYTASGHVQEPTLLLYGTSVNNNQGDGLHIDNYVTANSYLYQYTVALNSSFDNNHGDGIGVDNEVSYSALLQKTVLYGLYDETASASGNSGYGIRVNTEVTGGGQALNLVQVGYSTVDANGAMGISVTGSANDGGEPAFTGLAQYTDVIASDVSNNLGYGINLRMTSTGPAAGTYQYLGLVGSSVNNNAGGVASVNGGGVSAVTVSYFGSDIGQSLYFSGDTISNNHGDGVYAAASALGLGHVVQQVDFTYKATATTNITGNTGDGIDIRVAAFLGATVDQAVALYSVNASNNAGNGLSLSTEAIGYGFGTSSTYYSNVNQSVIGVLDTFDGNGLNGINFNTRVTNYGEVYSLGGAHSGLATAAFLDSHANGNAGDGMHIYNYVAGHSYAYQYISALDSTFDGNSGNGIGALNNVTGNAFMVQKALLYGVFGVASASGNGGDGIAIDTQTTYGGQAGNLLVVGNANVSGNAGDGIAVAAGADDNGGTDITGVAQYVHVIGSTVSGNAGYGINMRSRATGPNAITYQYLGLTGATVNANGRGVSAFEIAYSGSSVGQNLYFSGDTINNNTGDGVYAIALAVNQSFAGQQVNFTYKATENSYVSGNGGNGITVGAGAFSGSAVEQNVFIYHVNASNNANDGLSVNADANGYGFGSSYIYYSHVGQNVLAEYSTFDHNGGDGVSVSDVAYYGGVVNQFVELYDVDASFNAGSGFYEAARQTSIRGNSFAFSTNLSSNIYIINSTLDHNTGSGITLNSYANGAAYAPAFFGGYSYLIQHVYVGGSHADYNGGSGLVLNANQVGRYSLNAEYVTIVGSTFDHNVADGALFKSNSYYGPGGFGDTFEQISISGSDFSNNGNIGIDLRAIASGRQGRAEQHVTIANSTIDNNTGAGVSIYASATNGVYVAGLPCTTVQGLAGGCAFVRQNVVIEYSDISNNGGDGVFVGTYANNYGAIYGAGGRPHAPTLELYGVTVNGNGGKGLDVSNHASGNSYLYQYVAAIDSTFDHNASDGIYMASYVGGASTMLQRALLYSYHSTASASYNAGNGFKASIEALGGSYARDVNIVEGANLSNDGSFGFDGAVAYADDTSTGLQINAVYFDDISHNGDGIGLYSIGSGAQQISYIGGNTITNNAFVGVYGEANFGAFQYIGVYTFGNTVNSNGTDYLFNSFGGSTQILN